GAHSERRENGRSEAEAEDGPFLLSPHEPVLTQADVASLRSASTSPTSTPKAQPTPFPARVVSLFDLESRLENRTLGHSLNRRETRLRRDRSCLIFLL